MNLLEIKKVSRWIPGPKQATHVRVVNTEGIRIPIRGHAINAFDAYMAQDYVWKAALRLYSQSKLLPFFPTGRIIWIHRLLRYFRGMYEDPCELERYGGSAITAEHIGKAIAIEEVPQHRPSRDVLRAALVARDATIHGVAASIGLDPAVVASYEAIFWNVVGREQDQLYLRNIVYPACRSEEYAAGYASSTQHGKTLLRIAYNAGVEETLYFAGFRNSYMENCVSPEQAASRFNEKVMVTAYALVNNGFLNLAETPNPIAAAKAISQSSLLGGIDDGSLPAGLDNLHDAIGGQFAGQRSLLDTALRKEAGLS